MQFNSGNIYFMRPEEITLSVDILFYTDIRSTTLIILHPFTDGHDEHHGV